MCKLLLLLLLPSFAWEEEKKEKFFSLFFNNVKKHNMNIVQHAKTFPCLRASHKKILNVKVRASGTSVKVHFLFIFHSTEYSNTHLTRPHVSNTFYLNLFSYSSTRKKWKEILRCTLLPSRFNETGSTIFFFFSAMWSEFKFREKKAKRKLMGNLWRKFRNSSDTFYRDCYVSYVRCEYLIIIMGSSRFL